MSRRAIAASVLGVVIAVIGVIAVTGDDAETDRSAAPTATPPTTAVAPPVPAPELPDRGVHPELVDIDGWLQSDVNSLEELRGSIVAEPKGADSILAVVEHVGAVARLGTDRLGRGRLYATDPADGSAIDAVAASWSA